MPQEIEKRGQGPRVNVDPRRERLRDLGRVPGRVEETEKGGHDLTERVQAEQGLLQVDERPELVVDDGAQVLGLSASDAFVGPTTPLVQAQQLNASLEAGTADLKAAQTQAGSNLRTFVDGVHKRTRRAVEHTFSALSAMGLAAQKTATPNDLRQLKDFLDLAISSGRPLEVFGPLQDVAWYVLTYPDEARRTLAALDQVEPSPWKQKSPWMGAATPRLEAVPDLDATPPKQDYDVVIIGGGLSAGSAMRRFANISEEGGPSKKVLVIERDSKASREHAASLRNAGIVCTALDYVFDIDEAIGDKPIERLQKLLGVSKPEAEAAYNSLLKMMASATGRIEAFLKEKGTDIELKKGGGLDIARTEDEVAQFRAAVGRARAAGLDWEVVDKAVLKGGYGIDSGSVAGAMRFNDSSQLHPGKLVKALFDYAQSKSKDIQVQYETDFMDAKRDPSGKGWLLRTSQGVIRATDVIDAREAFAPYPWREPRYSQIHVVDVGGGAATEALGDTHVTHSLTYMRKLSDGQFMVGSGDFPVHDAETPPRPLASVALYAAANFKKVYPDLPFDVQQMWSGVFARNKDELPVAGELAKGWWVVGGNGGSGLNLGTATGDYVARQIAQPGAPSTLEAPEAFDPRRFFLGELRKDLVRALKDLPNTKDLKVEDVRVVVSTGDRDETRIAKRGDGYILVVPYWTLDAMNTDLSVLAGKSGIDELRKRETVKADWIRSQARAIGDNKVSHLYLVPGGGEAAAAQPDAAPRTGSGTP